MGQNRPRDDGRLGLVLPKILAEFGKAYPSINLAVTLTDQFVDIMDGQADLAIRISAPPRDKSTIWRKICHVDRVLVTHPDHAAAQASRPEDLLPETLMAYDSNGRSEHWELRGETRSINLRAGQSVSANSGDLLRHMALAGAGVALLPRFIVQNDLASGTLVQILPDWSPPDIWLTLYYPPYEALPRRVALFSDFFESKIMSHPAINKTPVTKRETSTPSVKPGKI